MTPLRLTTNDEQLGWGWHMPTEPDLYYLYHPTEPQTAGLPVVFLPVSDFLRDEPACKLLWELVSTQFRTRGKFLAIWSGVRFVAIHRDSKGTADGFLLVNAPVNWQIDYVVVHPDARGQGIAAALVKEALHQAFLLHVPYVMLTSKPILRGLYESCGFAVVGSSEARGFGIEIGSEAAGRSDTCQSEMKS